MVNKSLEMVFSAFYKDPEKGPMSLGLSFLEEIVTKYSKQQLKILFEKYNLETSTRIKNTPIFFKCEDIVPLILTIKNDQSTYEFLTTNENELFSSLKKRVVEVSERCVSEYLNKKMEALSFNSCIGVVRRDEVDFCNQPIYEVPHQVEYGVFSVEVQPSLVELVVKMRRFISGDVVNLELLDYFFSKENLDRLIERKLGEYSCISLGSFLAITNRKFDETVELIFDSNLVAKMHLNRDEIKLAISSAECVTTELISYFRKKSDEKFTGDPRLYVEVVQNELVKRLEPFEGEIRSLSSVTGCSQPTNTCPMIDSALSNFSTELEFEKERGDLEYQLLHLRGNLESLELRVSDFKRSNDSMESYQCELDALDREISKISCEIENRTDRLDEISREEKSLDEEIRESAENLRDSCDRTRASIIKFRDSKYENLKGYIARYSDSFIDFYVQKEDSDYQVGKWEEFHSFDESLLSRYRDFGKSLDNYQSILNWGASIESVDKSSLDELLNNLLLVEDLAKDVIGHVESVLFWEKEKGKAS